MVGGRDIQNGERKARESRWRNEKENQRSEGGSIGKDVVKKRKEKRKKGKKEKKKKKKRVRQLLIPFAYAPVFTIFLLSRLSSFKTLGTSLGNHEKKSIVSFVRYSFSLKSPTSPPHYNADHFHKTPLFLKLYASFAAIFKSVGLPITALLLQRSF